MSLTHSIKRSLGNGNSLWWVFISLANSIQKPQGLKPVALHPHPVPAPHSFSVTCSTEGGKEGLCNSAASPSLSCSEVALPRAHLPTPPVLWVPNLASAPPTALNGEGTWVTIGRGHADLNACGAGLPAWREQRDGGHCASLVTDRWGNKGSLEK